MYAKNLLNETPLSLALKNENDNILNILLMKIQFLAIENETEFKSSQFQNFIGKGSNMFHVRKNEGNLSLLLHILNNVPMTLQKREILIDLLTKIDKEKYPNDAQNSEYRIVENLKIGVPTSNI